MVWLYLQVI